MKEVDSKQKILNAAAKLFADKGFLDTSVKDICDEAKVNISSVNYHFETKQKLFEFILLDITYEKMDMMEKLLKEAPTTKEEFIARIKIIYETILDSVEEGWDRIRMILGNINYIKNNTSMTIKNFYEMLHEKTSIFIKESQKMGYISKNIDPNIMTRIFYNTIWGEIYSKFFFNNKRFDIFNKSYRNYYIKNALTPIFND